MTGCHPGLRVHEDRGVQSYVVGALLDELLAPRILDVVLQLHAKRAVVPGVGETDVDLGACVYIASALTELHDLVHAFFGIFQHKKHPFGINFPAGCRDIPIIL